MVKDENLRVVAVSLATTRTPDEVAALLPDRLAVTGVLVVFQEVQGLYVKAFSPVERGSDLADWIASNTLRNVDRSGLHAPADPAPLERGDYPIAGLWLEGDRTALSEWVNGHQCEVWALAPVDETLSAPRPSPRIDPT